MEPYYQHINNSMLSCKTMGMSPLLHLSYRCLASRLGIWYCVLISYVQIHVLLVTFENISDPGPWNVSKCAWTQ